MAVRMKTQVTMMVVSVGLILTVGCSGHSVKYKAASEGEEGQGDSVGSVTPYAETGSGQQFAAGQGMDGGSVDGTSPNSRPGENQGMGITEDGVMSRTDKGYSPSMDGSDYGHNYDGVSGSGPNNGPVSGFGSGQASNQNPDPEAWAHAYLGEGHSTQDSTGHGGTAGQHRSGSQGPGGGSDYGHNYDGVSGNGPQYGSVDGFSKGTAGRMNPDPEKWAETYQDENGGPSPELVDPTMQIAKVDPQSNYNSSTAGNNPTASGSRSSMFNGSNGTMSHPFQEGPEGKVQDIYFAFDSWSITPKAAEYLKDGAEWLQANPNNIVTIEGHCDQRGTQDYNLVLGKKRAEATRDYLLSLGIQPERVKIVSYGKERPFCEQENEYCYQENRRSHMVVKVN